MSDLYRESQLPVNKESYIKETGNRTGSSATFFVAMKQTPEDIVRKTWEGFGRWMVRLAAEAGRGLKPYWTTATACGITSPLSNPFPVAYRDGLSVASKPEEISENLKLRAGLHSVGRSHGRLRRQRDIHKHNKRIACAHSLRIEGGRAIRSRS